jgi:hypothetical protein
MMVSLTMCLETIIFCLLFFTHDSKKRQQHTEKTPFTMALGVFHLLRTARYLFTCQLPPAYQPVP